MKILKFILDKLIECINIKKDMVLEMADLTKAVQDLTDAESAMETRVNDKIATLQSVSDGLQAQIDALRTSGDPDVIEAALVALKTKVDAFIA